MASENKCIICGLDLGETNPRQYCCKTYCPEEFYIQSPVVDMTDVVNDYNIRTFEDKATQTSFID